MLRSKKPLLEVLATGLLGVLLVSACSAEQDEPPTVETLCSTMQLARENCQGDCEDILLADCEKVARALHPAALATAMNCFASGACSGVCLGKALASLPPTEGQGALARTYCATCAPGQADCASRFYERSAGSSSAGPGTQILPFADDVTRGVASECAAKEGCQIGFSSCALGITQNQLERTLGARTSECLLTGFKGGGPRATPDGGAIILKCTPQNCRGCCRDDLCLAGGDKEACGKGGKSCETCPGSATCEAAACKVPCGPDNCPGCCESGVCQTGTTSAACGQGGRPCSKCGVQLACTDRRCVDVSCKATCAGCCAAFGCQAGTLATACGKSGNACVDCGRGRTCSVGGCVLDEGALFDVEMVSAQLPATNKTGAAWDPFSGLPDPWVSGFSTLGSSSHSGSTDFYLVDTLFPVWSTVVLTGVPARELLSSFSVEVWDDDYDFDDYVGGCVIKLDAGMFDGALKTARCPATPSGVEFTLNFRLKAR